MCTTAPCHRNTLARWAENVLSLYCFCRAVMRATPCVFVCVAHPGRSGRLAYIPGIVTQIIHEFLDLMEEKSYFLKAKKCQFKKDSMEILGWLIGGGKIQIDPAKVKGISEWPRELKTKEEVRCTLGVLGYQRPFIRGFSNIARPLHDLTKKDVPFKWTPACTEALDTLIKYITSEPVLWHPDPSCAYELEVDASSFTLGSILFQRDNAGKRHAVAYHSRALTPSK
jgi:RNase H-like domain found in reverse transcriptase